MLLVTAHLLLLPLGPVSVSSSKGAHAVAFRLLPLASLPLPYAELPRVLALPPAFAFISSGCHSSTSCRMSCRSSSTESLSLVSNSRVSRSGATICNAGKSGGVSLSPKKHDRVQHLFLQLPNAGEEIVR